MYAQRPDKKHKRFAARGPWEPAGLPVLAHSVPVRCDHEGRGPWYVVVDELHGDWCRFTVDVWPDVDVEGRLVFDIDRTTLHWGTTAVVHRVVQQARIAVGQASGEQARAEAQRPLRIGDVFAVWPSAAADLELDPPLTEGPSPGGPDERAEEDVLLIDVTTEARSITHAAMEAVGAGDLTEGDLEQLGIHTAVLDQDDQT